MGGVDAAQPFQRLADRDDLACRRGRIEGAGGHAERARAQRQFHFGAHRLDFLRRSRPRHVPHGANPQRGMPHQRRHVDVGGLVPQRVQPCAEGLEAEQRRWPHQIQRLRRIGVDQRCDADAAIAGHHGRDSLRHLGLHVRMHQQVAVVMGMGIDEARREHASVRLDDAISAPACQLAHRHDPAAGDRHVRAASRCAGSVDHRGAPEQQLCLRSLACPLVFHAYLPSLRRRARGDPSRLRAATARS